MGRHPLPGSHPGRGRPLLGEGVGGPANIHSDFPLAKESFAGPRSRLWPLQALMSKA